MDASGPRPIVDRADVLKRESTSLLGAAVPKDRFIHREESQNDKGVDLSFEAIVAGKATQMRASVQLKATDSDKLNADGSFSFSIETKNLNLMLDGPCPLYVVWFAIRKEFRYAWARDEARRLHSENPAWETQGTIVIRFRKPLDGSAWDDIHDRIQREGQFTRKQHDYFARAGTTESVLLGVNPETLDVVTPDEAYCTVKALGIALVSAGYPLAVKHYARHLTSQQSADPSVLLAVGYACYHLGEHFEARGHLGRVSAKRQTLSDFDRYFLDSLVNECELRFGRVTEETFWERQRRIELEAPRFLALQLRLERLRWEHLGEADTQRRRLRLGELRSAANEIEKDEHASDSQRLQAAIILLFAELVDANIAYMEAVIGMASRGRMGQNPITDTTMKALQEATSAEDEAQRNSQSLLQRAIALKHPFLIAEATVTQCMYQMGKLTQMDSLLQMVNRTPRPIPAEYVTSVSTQLEIAISLFGRSGATESVVRATILLAQWHSRNNNYERAKELVEGVMGTAHGMGYAHFIAEGEAVLNRTSAFDRFYHSLDNRPDRDVIAASQTDAEVADFAKFNLETAELPRTQLPVIHRVCLVMREESQVRLNCCRHFRLFVDRGHSEILPTSFQTDPNWFGRCSLFGHRTHAPSTDGHSVIARFKRVFCDVCTDASPKRPATSKP